MNLLQLHLMQMNMMENTIEKYKNTFINVLNKLVFENRTFLEININLTKTEHEKLMDFIKKVVPINELYNKI